MVPETLPDCKIKGIPAKYAYRDQYRNGHGGHTDRW
jgi:hypothetical protein